MKSKTKKEPVIHPKTMIGHIHLKVSNLQRSIDFYSEVLGFEVVTRIEDSAAFLSAGGYHHHIGLNTWKSLNGKPPAHGTTGLYHFAILMPNRKELAKTLKRILEHGWPISGAADHGVSEAIYLTDPDGNGIEIYFDKPKKKWEYDSKGNLLMYTRYLDVDNLFQELKK